MGLTEWSLRPQVACCQSLMTRCQRPRMQSLQRRAAEYQFGRTEPPPARSQAGDVQMKMPGGCKTLVVGRKAGRRRKGRRRRGERARAKQRGREKVGEEGSRRTSGEGEEGGKAMDGGRALSESGALRAWAPRAATAALRCHPWAPSHHEGPARRTHAFCQRLRTSTVRAAWTVKAL